MDDGYGYGRHRAGWPGYDIGPDEDRGRFSEGTPVDMITLRDNSEGGMDIEYEQVFVARRPGEIFYEPIDETVSSSDRLPESRNAAYAIDSMYNSEANRLQTFHERWLEDYHVKPNDLARDGFIHVGPGDKVKCVFCLKTLRNWEPGDSVEGEHRKHYPNCPFVRGECHNVNIPLNITENMKRSFGLKMKPAGQHEVSPMQDYSQRFKSFEKWPGYAPIRPDALAEAGLYYSGTADKVLCFSCGKSLDNWEPGDDPWYEHAKYSPDCHHVHSVKGSEYVKQIQELVMGAKSSAGQEESSLGQESSLKQESTEFHVTSGAPVERGELQTNKSHFKPQTLSHAIQESTSVVDVELNSAPVKAILQTYDIPFEAMRALLERIKITGDDDLRSGPVKNLLETYDIPVETIREMLARVRVTKGGVSHQARGKDLDDV